jgi:hypothetical protein
MREKLTRTEKGENSSKYALIVENQHFVLYFLYNEKTYTTATDDCEILTVMFAFYKDLYFSNFILGESIKWYQHDLDLEV